MVRTLLPLICTAFLIAGCESTPQRDAEMNDTTLASSPEGSGTAQDGQEAAPGGQEAAPDGTEGSGAGPGVSLQAILDRAFDRDPQTGELAVLDDLREPNDVTTEERANRHDPSQTDTLRTLQYDGLSLAVYHVSGGKEILKSVTVTGEQYETEEGLSTSMSRSRLENLRGTPAQQSAGEYVYNLGGELPTMLHVGFEGDDVSRLEWQYPID